MNKKNLVHSPFQLRHWLLRLALACTFALVYTSALLFLVTPAQAAGVPGGNITNPVVRAVDLAKPAMVRILTSLGGRLTVYFSATHVQTFPTSGGYYQLGLSGSGTFISAHGDILTADHVVKPPHDQSLDQFLYQEASQDVADYINQNLNPAIPFTSNDAFIQLQNGDILSRTNYNTPSSQAYLSTDYTGPLNATDMKNLPSGVNVKVDRIEKESAVDQKDVAIVHVNMDNTPSVSLGDSSSVEQQDELTIIGFPGNGDVSEKDNPTTFLTSSVNKVYVSAIKQTDNGAPVIQVGGNVEHGDSGGPALDSKGNIVGIVSFGLADGNDIGSTSFLQASSSANELIQALNLDTASGTFEKRWTQAFTDYASSQAGHWHKAQGEFKKLASDFPNFMAVQPYLDYATTQANHETTTPTTTPPAKTDYTLLYIVIAVVVAVLLIVLILYLTRKGGRSRQGVSYAPAPAFGPSQPTSTSPPGQQPALAHYNTAVSSEQQWRQEPVASGVQNAQAHTPSPSVPWPSAANAVYSGPLPAVPPQSGSSAPLPPITPQRPLANQYSGPMPQIPQTPNVSPPAWPPAPASRPVPQWPAPGAPYGTAPAYGYTSQVSGTPANPWQPPAQNGGPAPQPFGQSQERPSTSSEEDAETGKHATQKLPPRRPTQQVANGALPTEQATTQQSEEPDMFHPWQRVEPPVQNAGDISDERTVRG